MRGKRTLILIACALGLAASIPGSASGQAGTDLSGLWEFNGGIVGVTQNPDKTFTGVVVKATSKGACAHPVGEQMWTGATLAQDTNFFGKHVWFLTGPCRQTPNPGNTAWKLFSDANGKQFVRGCYANWANTTAQPVIAPDGSGSAGDGGVCIDSYAVPLRRIKIDQILTLPKASACAGTRVTVGFHDPKTDAISAMKIYTNGKARTVRRADMARVRVPVAAGKGRLKLRVVIRTLLGGKFTASRSYARCGATVS